MTMTSFARKSLRTTAVAAALLSLAACEFSVTNPGVIAEESLDDPTATPVILNGLIGDLESAFDNLVLHTALASGELSFSGTRSWLFFMGEGDMRPEDGNDTWQPAATARWTAVQGVARLTALGASTDDIATANLYAGFAHRMMGETFCKAAFDGGPIMDRTEYFTRALTYFEAAASGSGNVGMAALAGEAQALLLLGRYDEAAQTASSIADDFVWWAHYTDNNPSLLWSETHNQTQATVWNTSVAAIGEGTDPRTPWADLHKTGGGGQPFYQQDKYVNRTDDHALAKGWEMRLIEAEALLRKTPADVTGAMAMINKVRAAVGLPDATASTPADGLAVLARERLATLWLEGRHLMDAVRFNDPFLSGRDSCFPFSDAEINSNPNMEGCGGPECT